MYKVGDKVKILPTILSDYSSFPYVGKVGTVCDMYRDGSQIAVEFSTPHPYLHDCEGKASEDSGWWCLTDYLEFVSEYETPESKLSDIWAYIE